MIYKFKTPRKAKPMLDKPPADPKPVEEEMGLIQGQVPDSKQEWWVANALNRLKVQYRYQYPVNAGAGRIRGSYYIDFVVATEPLATMIELEGEHWHTGEMGADDKKRAADIEDAMKDMCRIPIVHLWIPDLQNEDTVYAKLRSVL